MARSKTFGAPRESVVVRIQATKDGKVTGTQSYRVIGATLDSVCNAIEGALETEFGGGTGETDEGDAEDEPALPPEGMNAEPSGPTLERPCIEEVVETVRQIHSEGTFDTFMWQMRSAVPMPARKSVGALTGRAVMDFQNWLYDENVKWRLTDLQLLAVMRTEFPLNHGQVFTGDVETGLGHIASIRADYNRTGHGGPVPQARGLKPSVSYGRVQPSD